MSGKEITDTEENVKAAGRASGKKARAFAAAFPKTIPIMMGFLFLGMSYGIYMKVSGFSFVYPLCMSLVIFGMCDESFSINCSAEVPEDYWVPLSVLIRRGWNL